MSTQRRLAVLFYIILGLTLIDAAFASVILLPRLEANLWRTLAGVAGFAVLALPLHRGARGRATVGGLAAFVILLRSLTFLFAGGLYFVAGGLWLAVLVALIAFISTDADTPTLPHQ